MAIFKAAVVQLSISNLSHYSWSEVEKKLIFLFSQGVESGADLIVFPALTGLLFSPESRKSLEYGFDHKTVELVSRLGGFWTKEWLDFFGSLAQNYRVYVVPGTSLEVEQDRMFHRGYLLDENGGRALVQNQVHFSQSELSLGFQAGRSIEPVIHGSRGFGLIIGRDVWFPETSRILALQGANIIICLQAVKDFYDYRKQLAGSWQSAQTSGAYVLESCLVGRGVRLSYQGLSAIFGPAEVCGPVGILAHTDPMLTKMESLDLSYLISPQKEKEGVLIRNLDLAKVGRCQEERLEQSNPPLYQQELRKVYTPEPFRESYEGGIQSEITP